MTNAYQWFECLNVAIERKTNSIIQEAERLCEPYLASPSEPDPAPTPSDIPDLGAEMPPETPAAQNQSQTESTEAPAKGVHSHPSSKPSTFPKEELYRKVCAEILRSRCPACFGGKKFGRTFKV